MADAARATARKFPGFKLGKQQVFLPTHVITFLRNLQLPPHMASFKVPLTFTKFDLRDYLWNLYNVKSLKVRSFVREKPISRRKNRNDIYRPKPDKVMIVELEKPFQWPEKPTNLEAFQSELYKMREEMQQKDEKEQSDRYAGKIQMRSRQPLDEKRKKLSELAKDMLSGKVKWSNDLTLDPKFDSLLGKKETKDATDDAAVEEQRSEKDTTTTQPR